MVMPLDELIQKLHEGDIVRVKTINKIKIGPQDYFYHVGYLSKKAISPEGYSEMGIELSVHEPTRMTEIMKGNTPIPYSEIESYEILIPKKD
jgi:hypothetical protein